MANDPARQDRMPSGSAFETGPLSTRRPDTPVRYSPKATQKQTESGHQDRASGTSNGGHPKGLPFVAIDHLSLPLARNNTNGSDDRIAS